MTSKISVADCRDILMQAIDLHVHVGPEVIGRKFTVSELMDHESGKLKGIGVKNHFFPTVAMPRRPAKDGDPFIVDSVVLNRYVGGLNPFIVRASAELSDRRIIVWFPTLHSGKFLGSHGGEIPEEWIAPERRERLRSRSVRNIRPIPVLDGSGGIDEDVLGVLQAVKENDAILATGHVSWREARALALCAVETFGIRRIVLTHPIYQDIDMPVAVQSELAERGAFVEHCFSMHSMDKIPVERIAAQIKEVGADRCILSSDVGQPFSKGPSESLAEFIHLLGSHGVTEGEIVAMLVENPARLVE